MPPFRPLRVHAGFGAERQTGGSFGAAARLSLGMETVDEVLARIKAGALDMLRTEGTKVADNAAAEEEFKAGEER